MKHEIQLNSRDGTNNKLVQIEGEPLKFKLEIKYYYRVSLKGNGEEGYTFIDPAGGPFITIGDEIEGHVVKAIHNGGVIEFES